MYEKKISLKEYEKKYPITKGNERKSVVIATKIIREFLLF
jgi:hypothetical protein